MHSTTTQNSYSRWITTTLQLTLHHKELAKRDRKSQKNLNFRSREKENSNYKGCQTINMTKRSKEVVSVTTLRSYIRRSKERSYSWLAMHLGASTLFSEMEHTKDPWRSLTSLSITCWRAIQTQYLQVKYLYRLWGYQYKLQGYLLFFHFQGNNWFIDFSYLS